MTADDNLILRNASIEITPDDDRSIAIAIDSLPPLTETLITSLPKSKLESIVATARALYRGGLVPVPHIAARNLGSVDEFEKFLQHLVAEANVDRALIIGGDRDKPAGPFSDSLQVLKSDLLQQHGIRKVYLSCYPEGHPRIDRARLQEARRQKLTAAEKAGLCVRFISQFCFEAAPIVRLARELRAEGIYAPLRIGIAGPANPVTLLKYALLCGIGPSIRAVRERGDMAKMVAGNSVEHLLAEVAHAQKDEPNLGIDGVHFFTFGSVKKTVALIGRAREPAELKDEIN